MNIRAGGHAGGRYQEREKDNRAAYSPGIIVLLHKDIEW
jgi:hypothetical protein